MAPRPAWRASRGSWPPGPCRNRWPRRRCFRSLLRFAMSIVASYRFFLAVVFGLDHAFEAGKLFALIEVDQRDALRRAAHLADRPDLGADEHPAGRDQHYLIVGTYQRSRDDPAIACRLLDRDHALGAAAMTGVLDDRRSFAVTIFGRRQHRLLLVFGDEHANDRLAAIEAHPAHAVRIAAHRPHVGFLETHRLSAGAEQHHIVLAVGERGADQEITVVEIDGDDARRTRPREFRQWRLFHGALGSRHEHETVLHEFLDRKDCGDLLVLEERHEVDDRLVSRW